MRCIVFLLMGAVALAGCGGHGPSAARESPKDASSPSTDAVAGSGDAVLQSIDAPRIIALTRDGRARATLVNVWATWCEPCRQEFPELIAAANAHQADGVRLVLVSTDFDEQLPEVKKFLAAHGVRDTSYLKRGGDQSFIDTLNHDWSGTIPATFVYDAAGRRVAFWEGRADRARFEDAIRRALAAPSPNTKEKPS
jgi:thiol-disulfide isomerase/thioredoxin